MYRAILFPIMLLLASQFCLATALPVHFDSLEAVPSSGVLVVPIDNTLAIPDGLHTAAADALGAATAAARFTGDAGKTLRLYGVAGYEQLLLVGTGEGSPDKLALQDLGGKIVTSLGHDTLERAAIMLNMDTADVAYPAAELALGIQLGGYHFDKYQSREADDEEPPVETQFTIFSADPTGNASNWQRNGAAIAAGVLFARDLITEPANVVYPQSFVERTRAAFKGVDNVRIRALDVKAMEKLEMGALLGVGMGSARPPRLLVIEYRGADRSAAPIALVGKGVTFDSGGLSLKRSKGMWKMKYDMSGAAAVTGTLLTLALREAPVNAVAVAALVENMPSQQAQRPGDVRKSMSGKTIEIHNTDAEGRLILADAVWYAQREFEPALLVDLATLTGSVRVALGSTYAGLFSRSDEVADQFLNAGKQAGEEVWRLPLHKDYQAVLKSDIADLKNVAEGGGGASVGAEVIGTFVEPEQAWAHLDIASKAWNSKASPTVPKGAAGWGVRLLNQLVTNHYQAN